MMYNAVRLSQQLLAIFGIALLIALMSVTSAHAAGRYMSEFKSCADYKSPLHFVKEASLLCLKQGNPDACERDAKAYFKQCGFDGEAKFTSLSRMIYEKLFFGLVMYHTPAINSRTQAARR